MEGVKKRYRFRYPDAYSKNTAVSSVTTVSSAAGATVSIMNSLIHSLWGAPAMKAGMLMSTFLIWSGMFRFTVFGFPFA